MNYTQFYKTSKTKSATDKMLQFKQNKIKQKQKINSETAEMIRSIVLDQPFVGLFVECVIKRAQLFPFVN